MIPDFPKTLPELLRRAAMKYGERPAVASREGLRTRTLSHRGLYHAAEAIAAELAGRRGIARGQRVILLAPSGVRAVAALFGIFRASLVAVPLDFNTTPEFLAAVRKMTEAAAIVVPRGTQVAAGATKIELEDLPLAGGHFLSEPEPGADDLAEIVFTSGTTGIPKGVMLSHGNILSDLEGTSGVVPSTERMALVSILPLSHMFEQTVGLYLPLLKGGSIHYAPSLKSSAIAREIRLRGVAGMVVVPRFLALLMSAAENRARVRGLVRLWEIQHKIAAPLPMHLRRMVFWTLHRSFGGQLRYFLCGGAALSPDLMQAWERTGIRIIEGYGATECAPVVASNTFQDRLAGSIGRPLAQVSIRLSDDGELQVRGPNVFSGYWQATGQTAAAFTPDGWYRTEDVAEAAADGRLRIVGRLSERIVLPSGTKVFPADVEEQIRREPEIRECVVLGIEDERGVEHLHAVIRPQDGIGELTVVKAIERANARLASHQNVAGFTIWPGEFPKTALQKVKRRQLKEALESHAGSVTKSPDTDPVGQAGRLLRRVLAVAPAEIRAEMRLDLDLGLDSLGRVELAAQIEQQTGFDVPEDAVAALATAGDLAQFLAKPGRSAAGVTPFSSWPQSRVITLLRLVVQPIVLFLPHRIFARPYSVFGREKLPDALEPVLLIANHASHADTLAILRALPARLRARTAVAAAADYFFANRWAGALSAAILGAFPFSREGHVRESLENCGRLADAGWSILIYPEGTRSPDGRMLPFKLGVGVLATGLDVPVVPIAVTGGAKLLRKGSILPRRASVTVRFGASFTVPAGMPPAKATALLQRSVEDLLAVTNTSPDRGP